MNAPCETVTERIALGEPLGELRDHVASCARCERVLRMPERIAAATERPDPGLGFAARMTIGAQNKLIVRRRRRVAATAGASVATAALAVFVLTRSATPTEPTLEPSVAKNPPVVEIEKPIAATEDDLGYLIKISDIKRSARESASWGEIRKPLRPYIQLVKGVAP